MKTLRKKELSTVREEKGIAPVLEQSITDLEIENYKKDATITELQAVIAEDEQSITDLEIEIQKLKENI